MSFRPLDLLAVVVYAVGMLWLGWWTTKKIKNTDDYFVAGRSLPWWAVGMSVLATAISSITFLAYPGSSYSGNWSRLVPGLMLPIAAAIGVYFFVVFYRRTLFQSAYEYFERRYGNWGRSYASILFTIASLYRMGMVLYLMALPIKVFTGWSIGVVIIFVGFVVTIYTVMGGLEAVIWTDVAQGIILILGGLITIVAVFLAVPGGVPEIMSRAIAAHKFDLVVSFDWDWSFAKETFWLFALMGLTGNIQELSTDQTKVQRYQAAKTDRGAVYATLTVLGSIPIWAMFMFIGTILWVYYQEFPTHMPVGELAKADYIFPHFILTQLPPFIGGLVLAAVLAAAMSTIDSSMNGAASVMIADFYRRHFVKGHTDAHYLSAARWTTWLLGGLMMYIAYVLSTLNADTILDIGFAIGAVMAGGIGGFFLSGFLFNRSNERGAAIGLSTGILFIIWTTLGHMELIPEAMRIPTHKFITGVLGNFIVFFVTVVASYLFPPPHPDKYVGMTWWTRAKTRPSRESTSVASESATT